MKRKKLYIHHQYTGRAVEVPSSCQRLCAQCLNPMHLDYYRWDSETEVVIMYVCSHPGTGRFKRVQATLDKKWRLN